MEDRLTHAKISPVKMLSPVKELSASTTTSEEKDSESATDSVREQVEELKKWNQGLAARVREAEAEKRSLISNQRQQISHLASEFEIVRKELGQV